MKIKVSRYSFVYLELKLLRDIFYASEVKMEADKIKDIIEAPVL